MACVQCRNDHFSSINVEGNQMELTISNYDGFSIVATRDHGFAAIVRGDQIGPIFRNVTDAIDWAEDTKLGAEMPEGYQVMPLRGSVARLLLIALGAEYKAMRA
jgi:hypothetical protein